MVWHEIQGSCTDAGGPRIKTFEFKLKVCGFNQKLIQLFSGGKASSFFSHNLNAHKTMSLSNQNHNIPSGHHGQAAVRAQQSTHHPQLGMSPRSLPRVKSPHHRHPTQADITQARVDITQARENILSVIETWYSLFDSRALINEAISEAIITAQIKELYSIDDRFPVSEAFITTQIQRAMKGRALKRKNLPPHKKRRVTFHPSCKKN